jgi:hypothetical protein
MWTEEDRRQLAEIFREDDRLRAEREAEARQSAAPPREPVVVRKEYSDALLVAPAADEGEKDWSGWENWLRGHQMIERELICEAVGEVVSEVLDDMRVEFDAACAKVRDEAKILFEMQAERGAQIAEMNRQAAAAECDKLRIELRAFLTQQVERSAFVGEIRTGVAELERQRAESVLVERDARIERLEIQVRALANYLSLSGLNPPKEVG